jgi:hypothetical protein
MENNDPSIAEMTEEPIFGQRGSVIRVRRAGVEYDRTALLWGIFLSITFFFVLFVMVTLYFGSLFFPSVGAVLVFTIFFLIYLRNVGSEAAMILVLTRDDVVLSYMGEPPERKARVVFRRGTVIDVVLNRAVKSPDFGNLSGWSFADDDGEIRISATDGWELWDIQALRGPVYSLIEHHSMERGRTLRDYQEAMGSVPV